MYTEIEDTAKDLFYAEVGKKDHLGPDFPAADLPAGENKAVEKNEGKKNGTSSNKKKNDPKPYKKNGQPGDRNIKNKNGKEPATKKVKAKREPALPLTELKLGSKVEGRVAAYTDFGVFIRINYKFKNKGNGGFALLHNSQIRDEPVLDAKKLFPIGTTVKDLRVITVNHAKGEVGLSLRDKRGKRKSLSEFEVGKEYTGKVARVVAYGAFIDVGAKADALLHISRINQKKIENVNVGDTVNIRLIGKDEKKSTLAASMLDKDLDKGKGKKNGTSGNKEKNDPKASKKNGQPGDRIGENKNGKKPETEKVKREPALPLTESKNKQTGDRNIKNKNGKEPATKKVKAKGEPALPLTELKLGSKVEGRVAAFTDFGVFIKINYNFKNKGNGGYALLHNSQIRDEPVLDAKKLFRIGTVVKGLRVITVNHAKGEVGLSLRDQRDKRLSLSEFEVGKEYTGKVTRVEAYGAFIDVGAKANALLHISRINQKKIENIRNWVNEGDTVNIRLIGKDEKKSTLAASMLDKESDEFLNKRTAKLKRMRERSDEKNSNLSEVGQLKSELEYFNDAIKELEDALG